MKTKDIFEKVKEVVSRNKRRSIAVGCGLVCLLTGITIVVSLNSCNSGTEARSEGITDQNPIGDIATLRSETVSSKASEEVEQKPAETSDTAAVSSGEGNDQQPTISQDSKQGSSAPYSPSMPYPPASDSTPYTPVSDTSSSDDSDSENVSTTPAPTPAPEKYWVVDYQQVWVQDSDAWDEQAPIYGREQVSVCNICGAEITGNEVAHGKAHMLAGEGSGHHTETVNTVTGYDTIHHEAAGHYETVESGGHWE